MRFVEAVEASIAAICRMPEIGAPRQMRSTALRELRSWPVKDFEDIRIYYVADGHILRVVRVLHGKRDIRRILEREGKRGLLN